MKADVALPILPPAPVNGHKPRVFVSYSRKDAAFAQSLVGDLAARGFEAYLDKTDIAPGEEWQGRLGKLIAAADAVVFVISPDSMRSRVCGWEVDEAERLAKRILPVIHRPVPDQQIPGRIRRLNFIFMTAPEDRPAALDQLDAGLRADFLWVREHTRLGELAARWQAAGGGDNDELLRGHAIPSAEAWLSSRPSSAPEPTELDRRFIQSSRAAENARAEAERQQIARTRRFQKRSAWALAGVALLLAVGVVAVFWQDIATTRREQAVFARLAGQAMNEGQYDRARRFALQAYPPPGAVPWTPFSTELEGRLAGAAMLGRQRQTLKGHSERVITVAFSPAGDRVVTGSFDGTARLWDAQNGSELAVLRGHTNRLWYAAFSPDGTRVVTASRDATARLCDA
jgi:hypothetical protein